MVFNDTFNNIPVISWRSVLLVEETGVSLDNHRYKRANFTWKQHITSAEDKARRKMNIMRKLAGTEWGANEKVLKSVYQGNVRPYLEYRSSSWMTAAKTRVFFLTMLVCSALIVIFETEVLIVTFPSLSS
jgi:hypothetical protein